MSSIPISVMTEGSAMWWLSAYKRLYRAPNASQPAMEKPITSVAGGGGQR